MKLVTSRRDLGVFRVQYQSYLKAARNNILNAIRLELLKEAPSKHKGNKWSENKIYNYLLTPANCIAYSGKFSGEVYLDEKRLKHIPFVLHDCWGRDGWIYPVHSKALKICMPRVPPGTKCGHVYARVRGHKGNDFLERAYISSGKLIDSYIQRYMSRLMQF